MADRLYRSRDDRMLAGVAAGVAETLDADPSLIRIAWALLAIFTGGIAFVVYIVMAIVVPEAPAGWEATAPPGPPAGSPPWPNPVETTAAPAAAVAPSPAGLPGSPGARDVPGAADELAGTVPATPPDAPPAPTWSGTPPAAAPASSYWASDRETRRAARRARRADREPGRGGLVIGLILIVVGGAFLIREFVPWFDWHLWWPVGLIALGGMLLVLALRPGQSSD